LALLLTACGASGNVDAQIGDATDLLHRELDAAVGQTGEGRLASRGANWRLNSPSEP